MHKLHIETSTKFSELPFEKFNTLKYSVYVIDHNWNYLFVNNFVESNLGEKGKDLVGKNMWTAFEELAFDPSFAQMKINIEKGVAVDFISTSPINGQRLNVVGYPLNDCYFFYSSNLPKKEDLINELRSALAR